MHKEIIISLAIIALVCIGDFITQKYTKNTVEDLKKELSNLKQSLIKKEDENSKKYIETINKKWEDFHEKLAYYIEHNDLENIETDLIACKSFTETGNYEFAIKELDRVLFGLQHVTDKYSFNLENIF